MKLQSIFRFVIWEAKKLITAIGGQVDSFWKPKPITSVAPFLKNANNTDFNFIQIGANDGLNGDLLREYIINFKWHGILVEPVPYVYKRLIENYKEFSNLSFENVAIGTEDGYCNFYSIMENISNEGPGDKNYKLDQLGSFNKETLLKHSYMHPNFETMVKEISVPTLTIDSLFRKYNLKKLNLLQIDTEGYDFEILNSISFKFIIPEMIIFEHIHMQRSEYKYILTKMRRFGYRFYTYQFDTIGILNGNDI